MIPKNARQTLAEEEEEPSIEIFEELVATHPTASCDFFRACFLFKAPTTKVEKSLGDSPTLEEFHYLKTKHSATPVAMLRKY